MISVQPRSGPTPGSLRPGGPLAADLDEEGDLLVSRLGLLGCRVRLSLGQASPGQAYPGQASPGQAYPGQAYPGQGSSRQGLSRQGSSGGAPLRRGSFATGARRGAARPWLAGVSGLNEGAGKGPGEGRALRKSGGAVSGGGSAAPAAGATAVADAKAHADAVAGVAHGAESGTTTAPGVRSRERRARAGPRPAAGWWSAAAPPVRTQQ